MKTEELKQTNQFDKLKEVSIIGERYKPYDNSWQLNLSQQDREVKSDYLAGIGSGEGQEVTIISEPFEINVFWNGQYRLKIFVLVNDDNGDTHITLYRADALITALNKREA